MCQYCHCMPSTSNSMTSSRASSTTIVQTSTANRPERIVHISLCILLGTPPNSVYWRAEFPTTQYHWRSEHSPTPQDHIRSSDKYHTGNWIHKDSMANVNLSDILERWRRLETNHGSSASSVGISQHSCGYTICVSIACGSIFQDRYGNMRNCKSWIVLNAS